MPPPPPLPFTMPPILPRPPAVVHAQPWPAAVLPIEKRFEINHSRPRRAGKAGATAERQMELELELQEGGRGLGIWQLEVH